MYSTTRITDKNGNYANITYQKYVNPLARGFGAWNEAQVVQVSASDGRTLNFSYTILGTTQETKKPYLTSITAGTGQSVNYTHTYIGNLFGNDAYALTAVQDAAGRNWTYQYQIPRSLTDLRCSLNIECPIVPGDLLLKSVASPWGGSRSFTWTALPARSPQNSNSSAIGVATKTSSDGGAWTYSYTVDQPNVRLITTINGPQGLSTFHHRHEWNASNYLGTWPPVWSDGLLLFRADGNVQTSTYVWQGQPMSNGWSALLAMVTTPIVPSAVRPVLASKTIVRDGATYTTTQSSYDAYGNPGTIVEAGPNGGNRTTTMTYYVNTSKWIVKRPSNETTVGVGAVTRTWDVNGNLASENRDGVATSYTRHASGDIWTITKPRILVSTLTNYFRGIPQNEAHPEGINIARIVSGAGTVTSETNGEGHTTTFGYDGLNRVIRITPPLGNQTTIAYTATTKTATRGSLQEITTFDGFGRAINVTTGGVASATSYDSLGRKTFGSIVGYPSIGHSFQYDILSRVTRITHNADASFRTFTYSATAGVPTLTVRDERAFVTTHAYRAYGDPDAPLVMSITAPVAAANVTLARNGRGLVTSAVQAGVARTFNYDSRYYLTSTIHPEVGTTVYGRDDAGNMTTKTVGASGSTVYEYDGRNRPWRVTSPGGSPSTVTNTYTRTDKLRTVTNVVAVRTYGYDANQNLVTESLVVDGLTMAATYNHNANDQLTSIVYPVLGRTAQFNPDVLGRPTLVTVPLGWMANVVHWPNGQVYDIAFAGGSRVTYGMNSREWLNSVTVKTGDNVVRIGSTISHDVAGNVYNISDSVDASYKRGLAFDAINRLTTINGPWGAGLVAYDGAGNISSYVVGADARTFTYDGQNRLSSVSSTVSGLTSYGYDAYGNASPSATPYTYDNASNLTAAAFGKTYSYDGTKTRVRSVGGGGVFVYEFRSSHGLLLAEWRKQAGYYDTLKEHMHVAGKEVAEQQTQFLGASVLSPTWMFLQADASGSPLAATWAGGGLLFKENYQPYGSQLNGTASGYTQRAFAGNTQDAADLIYMGARYYNPKIGRFLSIDPQEAVLSNLHGLNRYAYANNNPYRYVDPTGELPAAVDRALEMIVGPYGQLADQAAAQGNYGSAVGYTIAGALFGVGNVLTLGEGGAAVKLGTAAILKSDGAAAAGGASQLARDIGILRDAAKGKGNFGLGSASKADAENIGKSWVGDGYRTASDGQTLISRDGLRQYRPPSAKPNSRHAPTGTQANFEQRSVPEGQWQSNGHLDITP